ncbi:hypothetical protein V8D89_005651 [Ganoderma adspersum]
MHLLPAPAPCLQRPLFFVTYSSQAISRIMTDALATACPKTKQSSQGDNPKMGTEQGQASTLQQQSREQYQPSVKPKLDIAPFWCSWFSSCLPARWEASRGDHTPARKEAPAPRDHQDNTAASTAFDAYCAQLDEIDVACKERESRTGSQE